MPHHIYRPRNPYPLEKMQEAVSQEEYITGTVSMELSEIVDNDDVFFHEELSRKLTGTLLLTDIRYEAIGIDEDSGNILIEVTGDPEVIVHSRENLEEEEEEEV